MPTRSRADGRRNPVDRAASPSRLAYAVTATFADGRTLETEIEITFEGKDGQTNMTLVQTGFPSAAIRDDFKGDWPNFLKRLEHVVMERAAAGAA